MYLIIIHSDKYFFPIVVADLSVVEVAVAVLLVVVVAELFVAEVEVVVLLLLWLEVPLLPHSVPNL